jgi:hypothetical protein
MTDFPQDPRGPDDDPTDPGYSPYPADPGDPGDPADPGDRGDDPWTDAPADDRYQELPPLDDVTPTRRIQLGRGRVVAAAAALVLVLGGGAAFAFARGGGGNGGNDGVASLDGSGNNSSDGSGSGNNSNHKPTQAEMQDAALKYAQCMRDHGVNMPDPKFDDNGGIEISAGPGGATPGKGGPSSDAENKMQTADKACRHFMDDVAPQRNLSPDELAAMQDKQRKLAECMRGKGYDFPDPQVDSNGRVTISSKGKPGDHPGTAQDDQMRKDMETCSKAAGLDRGPGGAKGTQSGSDT